MDKLTWYDNDGRIMCRRGYEVALARLASYEAAGLTPEQVVNAKTIIETAFADDTSKAERIRKLVAADDEGRVAILPCRGDADIVLTRNGIAFKPDHWDVHLTAFAENQPTPSGKKVALFDLREVLESMEGSTDV